MALAVEGDWTAMQARFAWCTESSGIATTSEVWRDSASDKVGEARVIGANLG